MSDEREISFGGGSWLTHALGAGGAVRVVIAEADEVADALRQAHGLSPTATRIATEATLAALLLSAHVKGQEKLTLQLGLSQPEARFIGEIDTDHRYRGRFSPSDLEQAAVQAGLRGLLLAVKHDGTREVYRGITRVEHDSITAALRGYLSESAQLHGVILTCVELDADGRVSRAVAALIERLAPQEGAESLTDDQFRDQFGGLERQGGAAALADLIAGRLQGERIRILEHRPVFWGCTCSRQRVLDTLGGLTSQELRAMADEDGGASVDCHFCNAHYEITAAELLTLCEGE